MAKKNCNSGTYSYFLYSFICWLTADFLLQLIANQRILSCPEAVFNVLFPDTSIFAGANIDRFQGQININGFLPLKEFPDSIQNWSQAGGFVEIKNFLLKMSGLESILNGSLTLDQNLQPLLVSTLKIKGYHLLLDEMGRSETINPKTKALGNIILNFFSRSNSTDEGSAIQIPLTIQDQWLSLGSFKVKKISSINW